MDAWHAPGVLLCNIKTLSCFLQAVEEEDKMTPEQLAIKNVGKQVRTKVQASDKKTFIYAYYSFCNMTNCYIKVSVC